MTSVIHGEQLRVKGHSKQVPDQVCGIKTLQSSEAVIVSLHSEVWGEIKVPVCLCDFSVISAVSLEVLLHDSELSALIQHI